MDLAPKQNEQAEPCVLAVEAEDEVVEAEDEVVAAVGAEEAVGCVEAEWMMAVVALAGSTP